MSASDAAMQAPATAGQTGLNISLGRDPGAAEQVQRAYIAEKQRAIDNKQRDIQTRYVELFKINARDAQLINSIIQEQKTYLAENVNTAQATVEAALAKMSNRIDVIENGLVVRTALLRLVDVFDTTVRINTTIGQYTLTTGDKRAILTASANMGKFYNVSENASKQMYLDTITRELGSLSGRSPIFENYVKTTLAGSPEYADIVAAMQVRRAGIVTQPSDVLLFDRLVERIGKTFGIAMGLGLAFWGGTLAANDAIFRPHGYRILNFIYGSVFFFLSLPYYLYRWLKGKAPTLFALLPLTTKKPETFFQKLIYGLFWYEENIAYENKLKKQWYDVAAREANAIVEQVEPAAATPAAGAAAASVNNPATAPAATPATAPAPAAAPAAAAATA